MLREAWRRCSGDFSAMLFLGGGVLEPQIKGRVRVVLYLVICGVWSTSTSWPLVRSRHTGDVFSGFTFPRSDGPGTELEGLHI